MARYDPFSGEKYYTPKNINRELMKQLFSGVDDSVKEYGKTLLDKGWRFYVVEQTRGFCIYREKVITIPAWIFHNGKSLDYKIWYISHEMAHAFCFINNPKNHDAHGPLFMAELIKICPDRCIGNELGYKPRNAASAGITEKGVVKEIGFIESLGF